MSKQLQPCPFCGSESGQIGTLTVVMGAITKSEHRWNCYKCKAWGPVEPTGTAVVWNTRPTTKEKKA